ncbi:MAG: hypothetical protein AB8B87_21505 [Granulosicoccus sp.]
MNAKRIKDTLAFGYYAAIAFYKGKHVELAMSVKRLILLPDAAVAYSAKESA